MEDVNQLTQPAITMRRNTATNAENAAHPMAASHSSKVRRSYRFHARLRPSRPRRDHHVQRNLDNWKTHCSPCLRFPQKQQLAKSPSTRSRVLGLTKCTTPFVVILRGAVSAVRAP